MTPDPWVAANPELAHNGGLALPKARVDAVDALYRRRGLDVPDSGNKLSDGTDAGDSVEHDRAARDAHEVIRTLFDALGHDQAALGITVRDMHMLVEKGF